MNQIITIIVIGIVFTLGFLSLAGATVIAYAINQAIEGDM